MFTVALLAGSCMPSEASATPSPTTPGPTATPRPAVAIPARFAAATRTWYILPSPPSPPAATILVEFDTDPAATAPTLRLRPSGTEVPLTRGGAPTLYAGSFDFHGAAPGKYAIDVVERLASGEAVVATKAIVLSEPEYVVWTLDFEGDAASDAVLANTAAIADEQKIPMTLMWNPRVWTTTAVAPARAEAMLGWTKARVAIGDELSLHLHMWIDFVRAAGVAPRTAPSWADRGDGYDVPMSAYTEEQQRTLLEYAMRLMAERQLARPTTFRAGGQFANSATLRALAALGFVADCSAVPAGSFGRLAYPWTLPVGAQPYRPSAAEANRPGDLALLEAPTNGGNTFGHDVRTIQPIIRANVSFLAAAGEAATSAKAITVVSHPSTIDATERAAIAALFSAFEPLRYDQDKGPLRFVTLAELAKVWR